MGERKNLAIGITVNLENYENLRLEVSGEVSAEEDVEELIRFLDGVLSRFGRGSPETKERIESYRRRVIQSPEGVEATISPHRVAESVTPVHEATAESEVAPQGIEAQESTSEPAVTVQPSMEAHASSPPPSQPATKEEEYRCERCGVPITAVQRKLSRLFQDRDLCKKCLSRP